MSQEYFIMLAVILVPLGLLPIVAFFFTYWKAGAIFTIGFLVCFLTLFLDAPGSSWDGIVWTAFLLFFVMPTYAIAARVWTQTYINKEL